jgi:NAD(P)-dependent dehydrogenase (short-subunit alcohol dehydrogenase family)
VETRVAVITGASSGIGLETALAFARRGWAVALAARRVDRLELAAQRCRAARPAGAPAAPDGGAIVVPTDVANRAEVEALVARAAERFGRLDVLVNNAGYGVFALTADLDEAAMRRLFDVNFYGVWYGMAAAVPLMRRQGGGHIFNVSSVIGKRGTPYHGAYCATKFAVAGLTEAARVELRGEGIFVTLVCPSLTETEFFDQGSMARRSGRSMRQFQKPMPAEKVGRVIARTAGRYRPEIIFSAGGRFLCKVSALSPRLADRMMEVYRRVLRKRIVQ